MDDNLKVSIDYSGSSTSLINSGSRKRKNRKKEIENEEEEIVVPNSLEEKHQAINQLFGFMPFANHITQRSLEERSEEVKKLYDSLQKPKDVSKESLINFGNILWTLFFGWWLAFVYGIVGSFLYISYFGIPYARWCWKLASYFFWPFGKYIIRNRYSKPKEETRLLISNNIDNSDSQKLVSKIIWYSFGVPFLFFVHIFVLCCSWMPVISIPMAKINLEAIKLLFREPLTLNLVDNYPGPSAEVLLCTYQAINVYYYKYTFQGMNVILVNLLPFVLLTLFFGYVVKDEHKPDSSILFFTALVSVIPLAYYIGMAVSSISAQTSFAIGAILNATFGSVVELILYFTTIALGEGKLDGLVQYSITGSLLSTMLLLPGLSMIFGGLRYKEQHFNSSAAGVSSVLLFVSVIGAFTPTIYYLSWGTYTLDCGICRPHFVNSTSLECSHCVYQEKNLDQDSIYVNGARPLMYACSIILPIAYFIGLIFTLKTHSYIFDKKDGEEHDSPEWGKTKAIIILIIATILFSFISEQLVSSLDSALSSLGLNQPFVGVFFLGTITNTAEIINAINFARKNNIALSVEIGAAATIQTALIQIPALVLFSAILNHSSSINSFTLIFPTLNLFSIIFGVLVVNYVYINGKTNYFEGSGLCLVWLIFIIAFYFVPS